MENGLQVLYLDFWAFFNMLFLRNRIGHDNSLKTGIVYPRNCRTTENSMGKNSVYFRSASFQESISVGK